jgi:hypothetical protein
MVPRVCARQRERHRANTLSGVGEIVLEGPERRRGPAADAGLLADVLDVVPDGLGRDAEIAVNLLLRAAVREREEDSSLRSASLPAAREVAAARGWPAASG